MLGTEQRRNLVAVAVRGFCRIRWCRLRAGSVKRWTKYSNVTCVFVQMRMVEGNMWVQKEGPYKSLDELWDGETTGSPDSKKAEE